MQFFEILFFLASTLLLLSLSFFPKNKKLYVRSWQIGLIVLVLHITFETVRWQMALCYFVFISSSLIMLKGSVAPLILRIITFALGLLFISTSVFYASMMPILALPAPSGPLNVGSTSFSILDKTRPENHTDNEKDKRELFVEVWYPADLDLIEEIPEVNSLWNELYKGESDRVSFFMNYLKGVKSHSFSDVPPDVNNGPFPIILFNHGMQMFTAQSTMLMEHLASHGYIVVSIGHPYESLRVTLSSKRTILPDFITSRQKFREAMTWIEKSSAPVKVARDSMTNVENAIERSRIMLRAIENSELNDVVSYWEKDNKFILDELISAGKEKYVFKSIMDTSQIGVMGMSIGGATATEFGKADQRIKAAINIDGLQYGKRNNEPLTKPFMMIYSQDGIGNNEFLRLNGTSDYSEITIKKARHSDFTDMTLIWPIMRIFGQLGDIKGERMVFISNEIILNFWNTYLKKHTKENFESTDYPEIEIYFNSPGS